MSRTTANVLQELVESINESTKAKYYLRQSNGGYGLYVKTDSGTLTISDFGYDGLLTAKEMYYYLYGLRKAINAIRWNGAKGLLKPKC